MLEILIAIVFIEGVIFYLLKRCPYPRLWVSPRQPEKWNQAPSLDDGRSLPKELHDYLTRTLQIDSGSTNFVKALKIMEAVRGSFTFRAFDPSDYDSTPGFFDAQKLCHVWKDKKDPNVNCGTYSHLFLSLCAENQIPSRMILMTDKIFDQNHVLSEIWDEESASWVLMDILYNSYFTFEGKKLSAMDLRRMVMNHKKIEIKEGQIRLDSYCTAERLMNFLERGLADYIMQISPTYLPVSRILHPAYLLQEQLEKKWWIPEKVLQVAALGVFSLFLLVLFLIIDLAG